MTIFVESARWLEENRNLVTEIARRFLEDGDWPTRDQIGRWALREGLQDAYSALDQIPPPLGRVSAPDSRIVLRVRALDSVAETEGLIQQFLRILRLAALRLRAPEEHPHISSADLSDPLGLSPDAARRLSALLLAEDWMFHGGSGAADGPWMRIVGEHTRWVDNLNSDTAADYLQREALYVWQHQDSDSAPKRGELEAPMAKSTVDSAQGGADRRKVFVIHGRNEPARRAVFEFLRAIGLDPIEWSQALAMTGKASPYIGEVLNSAFSAAQAVVVLQTPDDIAHLHESLTYPGDPESKPQMQPRPNVLFEAGMAIGRNEERTVIVELGQVKAFSDIHGRHVVRLTNEVKSRQDLANRLKQAGCDVRLDGTDWHAAGDLTPPAPPGGGLPLGRKLPSSEATGRPRLSARYIDNGDRKLGEIVITNHGPGDVHELDVASDEGGLMRDSTDFPVPKLPQGKSVSVEHVGWRQMGPQQRSYFNLTISGKTADGTVFSTDEFVSRT